MTTRNLKPADVGWLILWAWVFGFNTWALLRRSRGDQTVEQLSEACDRYLVAKRWLAELWLALFYIHLSNRVPARYDPVHLCALLLSRTGRDARAGRRE